MALYSTKNVRNPINTYTGWTSGNAARLYNDAAFSSQHVGGTHFLMGDGGVRFVSINVDFATYQSAASSGDGESYQISN